MLNFFYGFDRRNALALEDQLAQQHAQVLRFKQNNVNNEILAHEKLVEKQIKNKLVSL